MTTFRASFGYGSLPRLCTNNKIESLANLIQIQRKASRAHTTANNSENLALNCIAALHEVGAIIDCIEIGAPQIDPNILFGVRDHESDSHRDHKHTQKEEIPMPKLTRMNTPYAYSYVSFFIHRTHSEDIKEYFESDDTAVVYLTDFVTERAQRLEELNKIAVETKSVTKSSGIAKPGIIAKPSIIAKPDTVKRKLIEVCIDNPHKYYNYMMIRFPTECITLIAEPAANDLINNYISVQVRHKSLGDHVAWLSAAISGMANRIK